MESAKEQNFFEEHGLTVGHGPVEVGKTYPIFGMITKFLEPTANSIVVEINFGIVAEMQIEDKEKIELLKERTFESGIFVATICEKEPQVKVTCHKVIFGRKPEYSA